MLAYFALAGLVDQGSPDVARLEQHRIEGRLLVDAGRDLQRRGAAHVVVSRAAEPALLLAEDGAYEIEAPPLEPADSAGAGDSMTAGIAAGLVEHLGVVDAVRLGAAAGTLNATRHGKGSGHRDQVERLAAQIVVRPLNARTTA
jgi:1-phosphofructokinase